MTRKMTESTSERELARLQPLVIAQGREAIPAIRPRFQIQTSG
jgi:hypothetical protein